MPLSCALNPATAGQNLSVQEYIALAHRNGFEWVEFDSTQVGPLLALGTAGARELLDKNELRVASFFLPTAWRDSDDGFKQSLRKLPSIAAGMAQLGATRCCTWLPPNLSTPPEESKRWVGARFCSIAAILAEHGLSFGLEFIGPEHFRREAGFTFLYRMEEMLAFAVEVGPNAGLLVDSLHWHCLGSDRTALTALPRDRLIYAHINDAPNVPREEQRDDDRLLPGEGAIDLRGFLSGLTAAGYDGPVGIEIDGPALQSLGPDEAAARARRAWMNVWTNSGKPLGRC